ncbi:BRO family protein [uncultured Alistipes sp.]|jgi:DNA ligase (NAD+)|uniref:BRO family protein n=1 Tax=uncultured Alistipes sp. TaxID=538949 RepID=UPI0025B27B2C|nr:BRO family protein [uncultured Alistipes sp.]
MKRGTIIIEPAHVAVALSSDGTVWMTVEEIATIFHITGASVERHIAKLFSECELDKRKVRTEQNIVRNGRQYVVEYYNLDMIIALSYRIDTPASKAFRRWIAEQVVRAVRLKPIIPIVLQIYSHISQVN